MRGVVSNRPRYVCEALTKAVRDYPCQHCDADDGTVCAAHSNWPEHGKGGARKADDVFIAAMCFRCHSWLDQGKGRDPTGVWDDTEKKEVWRRAHDKTLLRLFIDGRLRIAE